MGKTVRNESSLESELYVLYQCGQGDYREKWRLARDQETVFLLRLDKNFMAYKRLYLLMYSARA